MDGWTDAWMDGGMHGWLHKNTHFRMFGYGMQSLPVTQDTLTQTSVGASMHAAGEERQASRIMGNLQTTCSPVFTKVVSN